MKKGNKEQALRRVVWWRRMHLRAHLSRWLGRLRAMRLHSKDFTIISNNCWGGFVYQHFQLPYATPTIGLYFFADDYIRFIGDLRGHLAMPLEMIEAKDSAYAAELARLGQLDKPVGRLGDVEIVFLHYKSAQEALEKWNRRLRRVNYDNLIVKFSYMNNCRDELIDQFCRMPFRNKFVFVHSRTLAAKYAEAIYFPGWEEEGQIRNDTDRYCSYINLVKVLNGGR